MTLSWMDGGPVDLLYIIDGGAMTDGKAMVDGELILDTDG